MKLHDDPSPVVFLRHVMIPELPFVGSAMVHIHGCFWILLRWDPRGKRQADREGRGKLQYPRTVVGIACVTMYCTGT